jgi:8-oxo-dGTP pyrophosphatase MutT (NUDIX family)
MDTPGQAAAPPSLRDQITGRLAAFPRLSLETAGLRRAAVAILVSPLDDGPGAAPAYVLTRRAATLRRGAGNYALPGGAVDEGEDAVAAALRETAEELGVVLPVEAALGLLDDFVTLSGFVVTPVVLWSAEPLVLRPDPVEVGEAWLNPLAELDHPEAPRSEAHPDGGEPILQMFMRGGWINPPTAAWLYQFREVALHGRWTRVGAVGQPSWTAR